ncbi:MAG: MFS transporter [Candidatus Bathyarchaeota archaeon]
MVSDKESKLGFLKGNVLIITIGNCLEQFSRMAAFPYLSLYILALGGSPQSIGLINSLRPLSSLFTYPLAGYFSDQMGRVKLIVFWTYVCALLYLFYPLANDWTVVAIGTFILGFITFQITAKSAIMADSLDPKHRGVGFAVSTTLPEAVSVFSPYFAGYIIDQMGAKTAVRYMYTLHVIMLIISSTIDWKFLKDTITQKDTKVDLSNLGRLLKESYISAIEVIRWAPTNLKAFALVIGIGLMTNAMAGPFWVVYATQQIGLSTTQWGTIFFVYVAVHMGSIVPAGIVIDRIGKRKTIIASFALSLAPLLFFPQAKGFTEVLIIMIILSLSNAFLSPASSALMADLSPREQRGKVMGAFGRGTIQVDPRGATGSGPQIGYAGCIPVMFGSIVGGYIYSGNPSYTFILQFILTVVILAISFAFVHEPKKAEV